MKKDLSLFDVVGYMLHRLHAHTPPIIHGYPRIHNIINRIPIAGEEEHKGLFWVDLAECSGMLYEDLRDLSIHLKSEVVSMVESMCKGVSVVDEATEAIDRYAGSPSREAMSAVMVVVAAEFATVQEL